MRPFFRLCLCLLFFAQFAHAQEDADLTPLLARLEKLEKTKPADPQNAPLYWLKIEQARLWLAFIAQYNAPYYAPDVQKKIERAEAIGRTIGDAAKTPFNFHERAYFAAVDGSTQPFYVALPKNYSPYRAYPLIVFLHGYNPEISKINPWMLPEQTFDEAAARGFILAIPYGRRNSDFVQWGEDDALRVKREVVANYRVDPARIFLMGASMGGFGAHTVGLHQPQEWAAVAPISARTDFYLWFKTPRESVAPWKRILFDADDPLTLVSNLGNVPFYLQHGALDMTVPVEHSRRFAAVARNARLPVFYREDPKGTHFIDFQLPAFTSAFNWLMRLKKPAPPRKIALVTGDLKAAHIHWARVEAFENYEKLAHLTASLEDDGTIEVKTENIARFVLEPPAILLKPGRLLKLRVNGVEAEKLFDPALPMSWQKPDALLEKSPARCGPFKNALRSPILLVFGDAESEKAAIRFREEWYAFLEGWPPMKGAAEVSDDDKAQKNLVLFGTRATNPLLAEIGDQLPLELLENGYRIGEKKVEGANLGLRMCWKSPWNEARMIVVQSGQWWGEKLPVNHKWDLLPDFIVYNEQLEKDDTNKALEAGYFDGDWNLK